MILFQPVVVINRAGERVMFRSRLEARWSVYFDIMGFKWAYEPLSFPIGDKNTYTPDFEVQGIGWIEIKPFRDALRDSISRIEKFIEIRKEKVHAICSQRVQIQRDSILILHGAPLKTFVANWLESLIILGGTQRREDARKDVEQFEVAITSALRAADNAKLLDEPMNSEERAKLAKWRRNLRVSSIK